MRSPTGLNLPLSREFRDLPLTTIDAEAHDATAVRNDNTSCFIKVAGWIKVGSET